MSKEVGDLDFAVIILQLELLKLQKLNLAHKDKVDTGSPN